MMERAVPRQGQNTKIVGTGLDWEGRGRLRGISLERQKAVFFMYCLIEFRNNKATTFNISYLLAADVARRRWKDQTYFLPAVEQLIAELGCNVAISMQRATMPSRETEGTELLRHRAEDQHPVQVCTLLPASRLLHQTLPGRTSPASRCHKACSREADLRLAPKS